MILSAKALLAEHPDPTEAEVREALAGNFCRCTGYLKPVEAVLAAAQVYRREERKDRSRVKKKQDWNESPNLNPMVRLFSGSCALNFLAGKR